MSEGPEFYDDDEVFQTYMQGRGRPDPPNETLEKPVLWELIGSLENCRVLDLGCGDAGIAKEILDRGAQSYLGVDGSHNMVMAARRVLSGTPAQVIHAKIESWEYPPEAFDLVISRLALHYIRELDSVFRSVCSTLKAGGRFVFSVEHPVITSSDKGWQQGVRQDWVVDDYFNTGLRKTFWKGGEVIKYHRTVEDYYLALKNAGFVVDQLREARPRRENFTDEATFLRRNRIPLFLILAAEKVR